MHRVEIDIRPENHASIRVVEKLGLRREGYYERFLDIDGAWRDHLGFAITSEEVRGTTMLARLAPVARTAVLALGTGLSGKSSTSTRRSVADTPSVLPDSAGIAG